MQRDCSGCTKCCEGFLTGEVLGKSFYKGKPCHFVIINKGCAIYEDRPKNPCMDYECMWKKHDILPMWMKPSEINTVIDERTTESGIYFLNIVEAGEKIDSSVLTWMIEYSLQNNINILWEVDNGKHWVGSEEFCNEMNILNNKKMI